MIESGIEWTDFSWNYWHGCQKVSPGCDNCYAERLDTRWGHDFTEIRFIEKSLEKPLKISQPSSFFVNAFSDFFDARVSDEKRLMVIDVMRKAPHHSYVILTKRPRIMHNFLAGLADVPENWIFGVSVEDEKYLWRLHELRESNCKTRMASIEPLLGAIDRRELAKALGPNNAHPSSSEINWVIAGGESGPNPRICFPEWLSGIRDVSSDFGIPFFLKQIGGSKKCPVCHSWGCSLLDGQQRRSFPPGYHIHKNVLEHFLDYIESD